MANPVCAHCGDIAGGCIYCKWGAGSTTTGGRMASIKWGSPAWVNQYIAEHGFPPIAGGSEDATEAESEAAEQAAAEATEDTEDGGEQPKGSDDGIDWKAMARKHEREAKKARREAEGFKKSLDDKAEQDKSEQEKALDAARKEAAESAKSETSKTYRSKIKNAEIRAQAAGRFADPSDAVALAQIDDEELFDDDGEISADVIKSALDALLESKPHLAAGQAGGRIQGSADGGKGTGSAKSEEDKSVDDHLADVQKQRQQH